MIDTDKYEGHTEGEWDLHSMGDGWTIGQLRKIDRTLMQDAPLLLEEVKRLRKDIRDIIGEMQEWTEDQVGKPLFRMFIDELKEVIE